MNVTDNEALIGAVGEDFLWNVVSAYVEADIPHIKEALMPIGYLDPDDIEKLSKAEVHQSDEFTVTGFTEKDGTLTVRFEMPAIIMAKSADESAFLRVTTYCTGIAGIPDLHAYNWNALDFSRMHLPEILSYSHLVRNIRVSYEDTEADDLTVLHW